MKTRKLSAAEILLAGAAVLIVVLLIWYLTFYRSVRSEIDRIEAQIFQTDGKVSEAAQKLASLKKMEAELDHLLADPDAGTLPVTPLFDNSENITAELDRIMTGTEGYQIIFSDPVFAEDGLVTRTIHLKFTCSGIEQTEMILRSLEECPWRCSVDPVSLSGGGAEHDLTRGNVTAEWKVTFYERAGTRK